MELKRRGMLKNDEDLLCPLCELEEENIDHLFVKCPVAQNLWMNFANLLEVLQVLDKTCGGCVDSWVLLGLQPRMKLA